MSKQVVQILDTLMMMTMAVMMIVVVMINMCCSTRALYHGGS
jgi:hypothetical protein